MNQKLKAIINNSQLTFWSNSVLNSYSQIFFSENKIFASILVLVSFLDVWAGLAGLIAVLVSNSLAYFIGYNRFTIKQGMYGFNPLLVGLGSGLYFQPDVQVLVLVFFAAMLTLFISLFMEGVLAKYGLPFLSLPFLLGIWLVTLSSRDFSMLGISERGIYTYNELYAAGGQPMVVIYDWFMQLQGFDSLKIYFLSLGSIFFQTNILSGILIAVGLLYYSRIAFSLSLLGFYIAYGFYWFLGANFSELGYSFIGFNYILTSIAIGGFFIVPSIKSYAWVLLLLPITVILSVSLAQFFNVWQISIYSLPFNFIVLLFLYILKLRYYPNPDLQNNFVQQKSPELSLYLAKNQGNDAQKYIAIGLPIWGEWHVSQAHNGAYTHKGDWRHAWDFIIHNKEGEQFKGTGDFVTDYFCYDKTVVAPADGTVVELLDGIPDNIIGDINTNQNWGNSLVIKHTELLYSQLSHLKEGSFRVKKGDNVKQGQIVGTVGNSGHSPYPHLHFQMQATPYIGSKTLDYPVANYVKINESGYELNNFGKPLLKQTIAVAESDEILRNALHFIPGQVLEINIDNKKQLWEVHKNAYNITYIWCAETQSTAYFYANQTGLFFHNFIGDKRSALFLFFVSFYQINTSFYEKTFLRSSIPPNLFFGRGIRVLQDFVAPFFLFLKSDFELRYIEKDDDLSPDYVQLQARIKNKIIGKNKSVLVSNIKIRENQSILMETRHGAKTIQLQIKPAMRNA